MRWNVSVYLIESRDEVFHGVVEVVLSGHDGDRQRCLQVLVAFVTLGAAQVFCKEAEVVERKDALVQLLLLFRQDGGDLLRKLDEVSQVSELLTDARHHRWEDAGVCHGAAQLPL